VTNAFDNLLLVGGLLLLFSFVATMGSTVVALDIYLTGKRRAIEVRNCQSDVPVGRIAL
jgi:hypothetical protein